MSEFGKIFALSAALATAGAFLVGCSASTDTSTPVSSQDALTAVVSSHKLAGQDARTIIDQLDATPVAERDSSLRASIKPTGLELSDTQGNKATVPLPEDTLYVSFAPYEQQTHDCYYHSLTTCKGEVRNTPVTYTVTSADGQTIAEGTQNTFDNGFIGLWLPRNLTGSVTFTANGKTATRQVDTTGDTAQTCVTDIQLGA